MTVRGALGRALHGLPDGVRSVVPPSMRQSIRQRIGPFAPWEAGFSTVPPAVPPGLHAGPPDFVGIGVQKAGTTWWYDMLAAHPGVFHPPGMHKERHFFTRFATDAFGAAEVQAYHGWFPRPAGAVVGEWTPDYLYQPWVAPLLTGAAPDVKLLVLLRDPVERFRSGLAHGELAPADDLGSVVTEAVRRGYYADALRGWAGLVPAGRLLVLQYERCIADPAGELRRTYGFLGVDDSFRPADLHRRSSPTLVPKAALADEARARLVELYADDVAALSQAFPDIDLELWPAFAGR